MTKQTAETLGNRGQVIHFHSQNRSGYLNLDTWQRYDYYGSSDGHRLSRIQRESSNSEKAEYEYL